jgi:uncharacterized membrane protein
MWFVFALLTMLFWGAADLFYKRSANENERYSHLKTSIMVGLVMGAHAIITLITADWSYDFRNLLIYLPVSAMYILSMTIGYFGLKYLELSISSPIQNSSGIVVTLLCLIFLNQQIEGALNWIAIFLISGGILALGIFEKLEDNSLKAQGERKYKIGFVAFFMPIIYCIFDALGTFFDAYYLDDYKKTPLVGVTEDNFEDVANISYELTFLIVAILLFVFVRIIKKEQIIPKQQGTRLGAALFETAGQFVYVRAMSGYGIIAAPMIAAYSIVSIILSRIFLKEKLPLLQYVAVAVIIFGIIILGVLEGMAE